MKYLYCFLLFFLISACQSSQITDVELSSLPNFIIQLSLDNDLQEDDVLCLWISQEPLWESGEDDGSLYQHINQTIAIKINKETISNQFVDMRLNPISYPIFDDNQEIIGSYGGNITVCIIDYGLETGVHTLEMQITNLSGETFSYNTQFNYNPSERSYSTREPAFLPTLGSD